MLFVQQEKNSRASEKSRSYENVLVTARVERNASSSKQRPEQTLRHRSENTCARGHPNPTKKKSKPEATKTAPRDKNYFYENTKHRTIPNLLEYQLKESVKTKEAVQKSNDPHKSEGSLRALISLKDMHMHSTLPSNLRDLATSDISDCAHKFLPKQVGTFVFHAKHGSEAAHASASAASSSRTELRNETPKGKSQGREEKQSFISYQYLSSPDEDDYRSECENCKSSGLANLDDEEADILNETMTLQRRPLEPGEEVPYYRTSLTLPTNTKKPRYVLLIYLFMPK